MSPQEFIAVLCGPAQQSALTTRIPASFVIAEGALESGWGTSQLCVGAMNLFGVKADVSWHGPTYDLVTREYIQGRWVMQTAHWRKYSDWLSCIADHAQFLLQNQRYAAAFKTSNALDFTDAVAKAGYATDPAYASKIKSIINTHGLLDFDKAPPKPVPAPPVYIPPTPVSPPVVVVDPVPTPEPTPAPGGGGPNTGFWGWLKNLF